MSSSIQGVRDSQLFIEGRDSNSILRDLMDDDRGEAGKEMLRDLKRNPWKFLWRD